MRGRVQVLRSSPSHVSRVSDKSGASYHIPVGVSWDDDPFALIHAVLRTVNIETKPHQDVIGRMKYEFKNMRARIEWSGELDNRHSSLCIPASADVVPETQLNVLRGMGIGERYPHLPGASGAKEDKFLERRSYGTGISGPMPGVPLLSLRDAEGIRGFECGACRIVGKRGIVGDPGSAGGD